MQLYMVNKLTKLNGDGECENKWTKLNLIKIKF